MIKTLRLLNKTRSINFRAPIQAKICPHIFKQPFNTNNFSLFSSQKQNQNQQQTNSNQQPPKQPQQPKIKITSSKQILKQINDRQNFFWIPYYGKVFIRPRGMLIKYWSLRKKYNIFRALNRNIGKKSNTQTAKIFITVFRQFCALIAFFRQYGALIVLLVLLFIKFINYILGQSKTSKKKLEIAVSQGIIKDDQIREKLRQAQSIYFLSSGRADSSLKNYKAIIRYKDGNEQTRILIDISPNVLQSFIEQLQETVPVNQRCKFYFKDQQYTYFSAVLDTASLFLPFLSIGIIYFIFMRSSPQRLMSSMNPTGKKSYKIQSMKNINVKFKDVAGMEQAKRQITQFVDFLKNSEKYIQMGAKIPKGALLTGPPGTGKTMLAKACAGQAGVAFFYISGSQFVQMFVGLGASKVRDLFAKARQQAPSIIFIDQIDTIGKKRQDSRNEQKDSTLNQLLVQMDGFSSNQTVIVMAASNRKQVLDNALTRPGRFDRLVQVTLPDIQQRQEIFKVHLKPLKIDPVREIKDIAQRLSQLSPGFSGADIANLCNEAAIIAARKKQGYIMEKDFEQASERVTAGYQKKSLVTPKTKKRVALHEAGHAVAGWFLRGGDPLVKLTIIPRSKGALGYAQYLPKSSNMKTKEQLIDRVAIMLGGITSQEIFYSNFASGGSDDLQKVYQLTRAMVMQYGMGTSTYNLTMDEQTYVRKQSAYLQNIMQQQVSKILELARNRSKQILIQKRQIVQKLAQALVNKETINQEDIKSIMGQRPIFQ